MGRSDDDRFRELIRAEFGDEVPPRRHGFRRSRPSARQVPRDFSMSEALDRNAPTDDSWAAWDPTPEPLGRPRRILVVGWTLLGIAVAVGLISLGGLELPGVVAMGMALSAATGLALLIAAIPRHRPGGDEPRAVI